jgi:hypothetical protein
MTPDRKTTVVVQVDARTRYAKSIDRKSGAFGAALQRGLLSPGAVPVGLG